MMSSDSKWRRWWVTGLFMAWLGVLGAAEPESGPPSPPVPPAAPSAPVPAVAPAEPVPRAEPVAKPPPADKAVTPTPRVRLHEVVSVGGTARVQADEQSESVVVINGDAEIDGQVKGDVVVVFGRLKLNGSVSGDVVVVLGEAEIEGRVSGDVVLPFTTAKVGPTAVLRGGLLCVGASPDIHVSASLRENPEVITLGPLMNVLAWGRDYILQGVVWLRPFPPRVGWAWVVAGGFLAFHLALALVMGGTMRSCMRILREQPARSFLVGLLACLLVGPVSLLLSFTVIALPLIWLVFLAFCTFGRVAVYGAVGSGFGRSGDTGPFVHPVPAVLLGSLLFYVSYMIPVVGYLVYWLVVPWGVGACLIRLFESLRREGASGSGHAGAAGAGGLPQAPSAPLPTAAFMSVEPGPGPGAAAAAALADGLPGPATHAAVGDPPALPTSPTAASELPPRTPPPPSPSQAPFFGGTEAVMLPRVGCGPRFGAALIDVILLAIVNGIFLWGTARGFWGLLALYHLGMWGWRGTTLGGTILGLRVVRVDGRPMDWSTAAVRMLASVISLVPLGLGFVWASWDEQSQSWHDRIAGTTIVRSDRPRPLV